MATFKSALRSYNAAVRRAERDSKRSEREAAARFKKQQKLEAIEDAKNAVESWEEYVAMIQSMHKDCTAPSLGKKFLILQHLNAQNTAIFMNAMQKSSLIISSLHF